MTGIAEADVLAIGMGVGREAVAGTPAEAGLDVVGIEAEPAGGDLGAGRRRSSTTTRASR